MIITMIRIYKKTQRRRDAENTDSLTIRLIVLCALCLCVQFFHAPVQAQPLTLPKVISLAKTQSVQAILARHQYLAGYWRYRSFKANYLPHIWLRTTPVNFNRTFTQRFDVNKNIEVYLPQRTIHSSANVSVYQNVGFTGGQVFVDADLGRLQNFGDNPFTNYSVTPFRVGISQPLFGYNEFKWERQLEPLAFQLAKQQYIADMENISLEVLELFFQLAEAQVSHQLAQSDATTADTLLNIARDRLEIGTITRDDVLELELRQVEAQTSLNRANLELRKTRSALQVFLNLPQGQEIQLQVPEDLPQIRLDEGQMLALARDYHPEVLGLRQNELEADQEVDRQQKENRFQVSLDASLGLNKSDTTIPAALGDLLDQEIVLLNVNIPLLDWGRREGQYRMAQSQREVTYATAKRARQDFEQDVRIRVAEFPILNQQVSQAAKARQLAQARYEITRQRFFLGNVDLIKLTTALQAQNQSQRQYLSALTEYWRGYYMLRFLTLFDIEKEKVLEADFEELLSR